MALTYFLAQVIGLYVLIIGITMLLWKERWQMVINHLCSAEGQVLDYVIGMIALPVGLLLVLSYNYWDAGLLPLVITIVGWIILLKSVLVFVASSQQLGKIVRNVMIKRWWFGYVIVVLVVGAYLAYSGLMMTS